MCLAGRCAVYCTVTASYKTRIGTPEIPTVSSALFPIQDGQIYITGTIFCPHPHSDLAQNFASHAVLLCYTQNEFTSIQR